MPGEISAAVGVIDVANGYAYFGTATGPGIVVKVALNGNAAPFRVSALTLNSGEDFLNGAVIDTVHGYAYFGTFTAPGRVVAFLPYPVNCNKYNARGVS